jgi:phenylacetate-CoA ligase
MSSLREGIDMAIANPRVECLNAEERGQQQLERLQSSLNRANRSVPFYRNRFQEQGFDPAQVESFADLARIPFTERDHLSDHYPYGLFAVPLRDIVRIHSAPGSGLKPTVSGYAKQDLAIWRELVARSLVASGVTASDVLQIVLDPGLANWGRGYKDGAEAVEASVIPLTVLPPEKQLMILCDYRTSVLITTPSAALELLQLLFRADLNPNVLALKTLILVGEPAALPVRAQLTEQLHVQTWMHYGLSEVPGPALAFECECRQGLHVSEDHFYPEIVDPGTGELVPAGAEGELILTTLTTRAFPLVRWRTGDRARLLNDPCPCGRTLRRLEWFPLRTDDMVVVRGVKLQYRHILLLIERGLGFVPARHRLRVVRREFEDSLEVWLCVDDQMFSDEIKMMERIIGDLRGELSQELGVPVSIRLKERGSFDHPATPALIEDLRSSQD